MHWTNTHVIFLLLGVGFSAAVTSVKRKRFRAVRPSQGGRLFCATDNANITSTAESELECSIICSQNDNCTGFNFDNSTLPQVQPICQQFFYTPRYYNFNPTGCYHYQVTYQSLTLSCFFLKDFKMLHETPFSEYHLQLKNSESKEYSRRNQLSV